jgi:hypothetical protein
VLNNPVLRVVALCAATVVIATAFAGHTRGERQDAVSDDAHELKRLFDEDQADRNTNMAAMTQQQREDWIKRAGPRDAARRKQVLEFISRDLLHTGRDYERAAFIFQHGDEPSDFLLAHTLASVAIAKGSSKSRWIAAATLDRYLQRIQQPQVYGTQFFIASTPGAKFTQEPYDRALIPDRLRAAMCVPDQAAQQRVVELLNEGKEPQDSPKIPGCS